MFKASFLKRLLLDTRGTSALEYALILAMVFLGMIVGLGNFANNVIRQWNTVGNAVDKAM
jgi:Flp pilus assembly pilin Flp